jgi:hypothetical protein
MNPMRLRYPALFSSLVLGVISHAQSAGIGIKGGALVSTVKAIHYRTTPIPGATAGLYMPWGVAPLLELQPEVLVTALGAGFTAPDGDRSTVRSLYVQVPVVLKKYFNNRFNVALGYQFNRILMAQEVNDQGSSKVTDRFENMDMGFVGGAGFDLQSGLDLSLRAYSAMTHHYANDNAIYPKHRSLQLTVGYRFVQFHAPGLSRHRRR